MSNPTVTKRKKADDTAVAELAAKMLSSLESLRVLGGDAYPPTLRRLAELCDMRPSDLQVTTAANKKAFTERAVVTRKAKGKPVLNAPVVFKDNIESVSQAITSALLLFALRDYEPKVKNRVFSEADLKKRITKALHRSFQEGLKQGIEHETLPSDVAWVPASNGPRLFLVADLHPAPLRESVWNHRRLTATPIHESSLTHHEPLQREFAEAFREAFEQLDRDNGSTNFVTLADLRRALPEFDRVAFDAGLRQLRIDGQFSLDSHEGQTGSLTPEEREAGVQEAGSLLVYVSRRKPCPTP